MADKSASDEARPSDGRYVPSQRTRWLLLGAALLLGWFALRGALQSAFLDGAPEIGAQLWPADGATLDALAHKRVAAASGSVDDETRSLYQGALTSEPLLAGPLALAGIDAANSHNTARAERLMLAARDRDMRDPLVRFWLLDHFARTGHYAQALDEVGPAIRLRPEALAAVMTVVAAVAGTPDGNAAVADKLATHPFWGTVFFQTAAKTTSPEALLRLLARMPDASRAVAEQRAVLLSLIDAGKGAQAYQAWRGFLPETFQPRASGVYDGNFAGWPGAQPFNWMLTEDASGVAHMVQAGDLPQSSALDVRYFGSSTSVMAQQYVYATPGSYRLQGAARSRSTGVVGGRLNLDLVCLRGDVLATLPLTPLGGQLQSFAMPVTVPAGCDLMRLRVVGVPGEMFSEIEAQITGVALTPGS
jgi:hypothetical protein